MEGQTSPWGTIQHATEIADGLWSVSTAGHGGIWVGPERRERMVPELVHDHGAYSTGWYEEDCEWARVVGSFPEHFAPLTVALARRTLHQWAGPAYDSWTGERRERFDAIADAFEAAEAAKWLPGSCGSIPAKWGNVVDGVEYSWWQSFRRYDGSERAERWLTREQWMGIGQNLLTELPGIVPPEAHRD